MLEQSLVAGTLEAPEASLLYAGILLDTKQFTKNTGTRTFSAAFYLRDAGADPSIVQELFRITADDFVRESRFDSAMRICRKGIVITALQEQGDSYDRIAAAKAADRLLQLEGIEAAFALVRIEDTVYISGRSSGRLNVQLILEPLGGGGRFDAAGAQIKGATIKDADDRLCALIDSYLKQ
jgi:c-di-AMP phosphodiesterase-like protein